MLNCRKVFSVTVLVISSQAPKETLTCILDCMAHMLKIPEEVEKAFLKRTIKAFTWVTKTNQPESFVIILFISQSLVGLNNFKNLVCVFNRWILVQRMGAECLSP